jgi:hypothetical protein
MKRILLAAGVASAALLMAGLTAPAALAAPNATCTGTLPPGTYQNVTVPAGASCTINGSDNITGDVTVATGATLDDEGASIGGNLQADHALEISVIGGSVGGNLQLTATSQENVVCGETVGNDLVVQNGAQSLIGSGLIGIERCFGSQNTIRGNLTVQNNPGRVDVENNTAAGNIAVHNNAGGGTLDTNSAGSSCQLFNDNPPITGTGNSVPPGHQNTCNQLA